MVFVEQEAHKKTEVLAECEMCESKIPDAKSCYVNPVEMKFLCVKCFSDVPTLDDAEELCRKIIKHQAFWSKRKDEFVSFTTLGAKSVEVPHQTSPTSPDASGLAGTIETVSLEEALTV